LVKERWMRRTERAHREEVGVSYKRRKNPKDYRGNKKKPAKTGQRAAERKHIQSRKNETQHTNEPQEIRQPRLRPKRGAPRGQKSRRRKILMHIDRFERVWNYIVQFRIAMTFGEKKGKGVAVRTAIHAGEKVGRAGRAKMFNIGTGQKSDRSKLDRAGGKDKGKITRWEQSFRKYRKEAWHTSRVDEGLKGERNSI